MEFKREKKKEDGGWNIEGIQGRKELRKTDNGGLRMEDGRGRTRNGRRRIEWRTDDAK